MAPPDSFDRRALLRLLPLAAVGAGAGLLGPGRVRRPAPPGVVPPPPAEGLDTGTAPLFDPTRDEGGLPPVDPTAPPHLQQERLAKIRRFEEDFADDVWIEAERFDLLVAASRRLERAERLIGHGHFNLLGFDRYLSFARNYSEIGAPPRAELDLLEEVFAADARRYGFFGERVVEGLTAAVDRSEVVKIEGTGHYLFRGEPRAKFERIVADVGDSVYVSSGVRGLVKQFRLFLAKAIETGGNLSRASRSLAPPGYSFHARGDFDIGKVGFGSRNFSASFAETDVYRKMVDLGYVAIRYTEANPFGVRHEPWHIKIG